MPHLNSLAPGKFEWHLRYVIFKWILVIDGWGISCEVALIWMSLDFTDDPSTLLQVMAWCRQATSHYLSQCWPRSLSSNGITRPQCVNIWHWMIKDGDHFEITITIIAFATYPNQTQISALFEDKYCHYFPLYPYSRARVVVDLLLCQVRYLTPS